jgi:2-keto-3-deoxy-L-rhamnonate aldolase RhmA
MEIRTNKIKNKLLNNEIVTVAMADFPITAGFIDFIGQYGFDGVWIEAEHGAIDFADIPDMTRAADLWDMTSIVRINLNLPSVIYRTLDVGAQGIIMPHVNTADEARIVASSSKFYPLGNRGMFTSRQGIGVEDYTLKANDETLVVILIEDIVAIENLSEILTVDNIDVFFVASSDLAQSMGLINGENHPQVVKIIDDSISKILDSGKIAGFHVVDSDVEDYISKGVKFISTGVEQWLEKGAKNFLDRCKNSV